MQGGGLGDGRSHAAHWGPPTGPTAVLPLAGAPIELSKTEVTMRNERSHVARLGERQGLAVEGLATLGIEPVGVARDIAEEMQGMGDEPVVTR